MRPSPVEWLLCLGALVGTLWGIGMLLPGGAQADTAPLPSKGPVSSAPENLTLHFEYDFEGRRYSFDCGVDANFARRQEKDFGYPRDREAIWNEMDRILQRKIEEEIGPLARYARIAVTHNPTDTDPQKLGWKPHLGYSLPAKSKIPVLLHQAADGLPKLIEKKVPELRGRIYGEYYLNRGFKLVEVPELRDQQLEIAYKSLADVARPMLADCFDTLNRQVAPTDEELRDLLVAYFYRMEIPSPDEVAREELADQQIGIRREGFWVPTKVLRLRRGDCDAKSTALDALWQRPTPEILLFVVKAPEQTMRHAFLGIATEASVKGTLPRGLRHYRLYEMRSDGPSSEGLHDLLERATQALELCLTEDCYGTEL
jgi:hypothetical protein